jgi:hypothetical protein
VTGALTAVVPLPVMEKVIACPDLEPPFNARRGGCNAKAKIPGGAVQALCHGSVVVGLKDNFLEATDDNAWSCVVPHAGNNRGSIYRQGSRRGVNTPING